MRIIGFGHSKRAGKDTIAEMVAGHLRTGTNWSVQMTGFADKLKEVCHNLYGWDGLMGKDFYNTPEGAPLREVPLPTIGKSPRQIWIDMGTPAVRERVYDMTWVEFTLRPANPPDVLIIPDVRFPNEAQRIHELGGILVQVERPGFPAGNDVADQALVGYEGWTAKVTNDRDLQYLDYWAEIIACHVGGAFKDQTLQELLDNARTRLDESVAHWQQVMSNLQNGG